MLRAANSGFTEDGALREFMPLHGGWSDSVFMDIPILAKAGALSGDRKYFDMAARHFAFMQKIVGRPDGLYRHQASTDAAWGRGNGFPALGLALTLSDFPKDHPDYPALLAAFQRHMKALVPLQDENGMFREVLDYPGAYPEYSGTAMIATAMMRGIRKGWLDAATYQPIVDRAWQAVLLRTAPDGRLFDVAEKYRHSRLDREGLSAPGRDSRSRSTRRRLRDAVRAGDGRNRDRLIRGGHLQVAQGRLKRAPTFQHMSATKIALRPFENLSGDPSQDVLARGLGLDLATECRGSRRWR